MKYLNGVLMFLKKVNDLLLNSRSTEGGKCETGYERRMRTHCNVLLVRDFGGVYSPCKDSETNKISSMTDEQFMFQVHPLAGYSQTLFD